MSRITRLTGLLVGGLFVVAPLAGQDRSIAFQAMGGGYYHTRNLTALPNSDPAVTHWSGGFNMGVGVGVFFNKYLGLHGDLTLGNNQMLGGDRLSGSWFNKLYYGGHVELQYPLSNGFAPYMFAGAGGVTVHQDTGKQTVPTFTKMAEMFGAGLSYKIPNSKVEIFGEGKGLTYQFVGGGFDRRQLDVTISLGLGYRLGF
jgi:opacity protein-like surface antigen